MSGVDDALLRVIASQRDEFRAEAERLRGELAAARAEFAAIIAEKPGPTAWAYGKACAAVVKHRAKAERLSTALRVLVAAARALIAALPACDVCGAPAMRAFGRGGGRWCDVHKIQTGRRLVDGMELREYEVPEYQRAVPLRYLMTLTEAPP